MDRTPVKSKKSNLEVPSAFPHALHKDGIATTQAVTLRKQKFSQDILMSDNSSVSDDDMSSLKMEPRKTVAIEEYKLPPLQQETPLHSSHGRVDDLAS